MFDTSIASMGKLSNSSKNLAKDSSNSSVSDASNGGVFRNYKMVPNKTDEKTAETIKEFINEAKDSQTKVNKTLAEGDSKMRQSIILDSKAVNAIIDKNRAVRNNTDLKPVEVVAVTEAELEEEFNAPRDDDKRKSILSSLKDVVAPTFGFLNGQNKVEPVSATSIKSGN